MEFNKKLQELRKQKGLTQEELAHALFVSRTAISKWESGRGYPNIDSLKAIAKFFNVSIDELLSGEQLLSLAEEDTKQKESYARNLVFGLLDLSASMFLFLPLFGQKENEIIKGVSLLSLNSISPYLKIGYYAVIIGLILWGILTLALQNCEQVFWVRNKIKASLFLSTIGVVLFIISLQPYAAIFLFAFLIIKILMLIKKP